MSDERDINTNGKRGGRNIFTSDDSSDSESCIEKIMRKRKRRRMYVNTSDSSDTSSDELIQQRKCVGVSSHAEIKFASIRICFLTENIE